MHTWVRNPPVLSKEQIEEAKTLREQGYSKRQLAKRYGVGETTIWENVFSSQKRIRIQFYRPRKKDTRETCPICELKITREVNTNYIPVNFQVKDKCLGCYLKEHGLDYKHLL